MHYITSAWSGVSASTAQHCFARYGFRINSKAQQSKAAPSEKELKEAINALGATDTTYDNYVTVDAAVVMLEYQSITKIVAN